MENIDKTHERKDKVGRRNQERVRESVIQKERDWPWMVMILLSMVAPVVFPFFLETFLSLDDVEEDILRDVESLDCFVREGG